MKRFLISGLFTAIFFAGIGYAEAGLFDRSEQPVAEHVNKEKDRFDLSFLSITENYKAGFDNFWFHPVHTPQEQADEYGTESVILFTNSELTKSYILSVDSDALEQKYLEAPQTVTINPDGTATITE